MIAAYIKNLQRFTLCLLLFATALQSQDTPPSNEALLQRLYINSILDVVDSINTDSLPLFLENSAAQTSLNRWLLQNLQDSCLTHKYLVYSSAQSEGVDYLVARLGDVQSEISYKSAGRRFLLFDKGITRQVETRAHFSLFDASGLLVYSETLHSVFQDQLENDAVSEVEDPNYLFTRGTKASDSVIQRWIEPGLVTAVTGAVVATFFILRSEN